MKQLRKKFELFCMKNHNLGIPNLMLYIAIGNAVVYLMSELAGSTYLYQLLCFDRTYILRGQIWRLITYPLTMYTQSILLMAVSLFCYYSLGQAIENQWGTLKFNLFYLSGIVMMDIYALVFKCNATVYYLNMSLFLTFATLYPNAGFLLFFIIPVKAWIFALFDLAIIAIGLIQDPFPLNVFPIIALGNYFLFMGMSVLNLFPYSFRTKVLSIFGVKSQPIRAKVIPFREKSKEEKTYTHRCTVCGRTDVTNPNLEFRYCSKCNGYYCYCEEHISNHVHIQ